jgi:hypothetical protein
MKKRRLPEPFTLLRHLNDVRSRPACLPAAARRIRAERLFGEESEYIAQALDEKYEQVVDVETKRGVEIAEELARIGKKDGITREIAAEVLGVSVRSIGYRRTKLFGRSKKKRRSKKKTT